MALVTPKDTKRIDIPHEPEHWMEFRPIQAGDLNLLQAVGGQEVRVSLELAARILQRWSYDTPLPEDDAGKLALINQLDLNTYVWITEELGETLLAVSGVRKDKEKDFLGNGSSPTSRRPKQQSSLVNSGT